MNSKEVLTKWLEELKPVNESPNCVYKLLSEKKIILYGAGDGLITFSAFVLFRYNLKAEAVLDKKYRKGDYWYDIPLYSPLEYLPTNDEKENAIVIITVGKIEYHQDVLDNLRSLGFKNIVFAVDIYEYHLPSVSEDLREKNVDYYLNSRELILESLALFRDEESSEVFMRFMETHLKRKQVFIPSHPIEEQYFPSDITLKRGNRRVINCGSYNGDTAIKICTLWEIESLACFEPDLENFSLLRRNLEKYHPDLETKLILYPCGVYSSETQLRFTGSKRINSMISYMGESVIQGVALDHVLPGFRPDFINMDVEGAELEALMGAETLIRESRPDLAICVYHSPAHVWEIPLFINSLGLGYEFYLRNYTSYSSETVLYATVVGRESK